MTVKNMKKWKVFLWSCKDRKVINIIEIHALSIVLAAFGLLRLEDSKLPVFFDLGARSSLGTNL